MRIANCRFDDLNGCDFFNCRETYIDNSNFNSCSKAFILKNATETRIQNSNIRVSGYGIYAAGDFSTISNGFHAGIYFDHSFILGCTNYPIYCTYLDFASITSSMIDYNDKPSYFKSLDLGNFTGNFFGTRIGNGINDNGKALIINGNPAWPVTNWDDRSHNISISNNRFLCHTKDGSGDNSSNIDAVLIENSDYVDFSNNHVYLYNRYGINIVNCISLKLNDNVITRNTTSTVTSRGIYGAGSTGGTNNFACNNYLDAYPNDFEIPVNGTIAVTTDKQLQNIINKGGNKFGSAINIGAIDDNPVSIISNGVATLNVGKDYIVANSSLRVADGKFLQFLSAGGSTLSSVLGVSGGSLLIGDLFSGQLFTSGPVIMKSGGNDRLKIDTKVQIKRFGDAQWYDVVADDGLIVKQGGNQFNSTVSIGSKDNFPVNIISNNSPILSISGSGTSVNSNLRILGANFLQLSSFDNSSVASVMGIESGTSNLIFGNIFGQLLNNGSITFKGTTLTTPTAPADLFKISNTVQRQLTGNWYNVAVDNYFIPIANSTASLSIDFANFNVRSISLVTNTALTYTNLTLRKGTYTILIKQDATGGRTLSFPPSSAPGNYITYTKGSIDLAPNAYSVLNINDDGTSNVFVNITPGWIKIP